MACRYASVARREWASSGTAGESSADEITKTTMTTPAEGFQRVVAQNTSMLAGPWVGVVKRLTDRAFRASAHVRDLCRRGECRRASSPQPLPWLKASRGFHSPCAEQR